MDLCNKNFAKNYPGAILCIDAFHCVRDMTFIGKRLSGMNKYLVLGYLKNFVENKINDFETGEEYFKAMFDPLCMFDAITGEKKNLEDELKSKKLKTTYDKLVNNFEYIKNAQNYRHLIFNIVELYQKNYIQVMFKHKSAGYKNLLIANLVNYNLIEKRGEKPKIFYSEQHFLRYYEKKYENEMNLIYNQFSNSDCGQCSLKDILDLGITSLDFRSLRLLAKLINQKIQKNQLPPQS